MENFDITLMRDEAKNEYFYVDENNGESERFYEAELYQDGFAKVRKTKNSKIQYRDLLGRLSDQPTDSGKQFFEYLLGLITYQDLHIEYFADQIFCIGVKQEILRKSKALATQSYNSGLKVSKKEFEKTIDKRFNEIDLKHIFAVELDKTNAEIDKIYENKRSDENKELDDDEDDETMDFLDDIDV